MRCKITRAASRGTIGAIPSKSAAHRWLIAAALSGLDISGAVSGVSQDIDATRDCLEAMLGPGITPITLEPRESGSTLRFLVPLSAALGIPTNFNCKGRLADRPMEIMRRLLEEHGCTMSPQGSNPIEIRGRLTSGIYSLPGNVSSQYITGLLLALPLLEGDSVIRVEKNLQSRPYVEMTLEMLKQSGIEIKEDGAEFRIRGSQKYDLKSIPEIEGDWSNAAFWLVLDAINRLKESAECGSRTGRTHVVANRIEVTGLREDSVQGDKAIMQIIEEALTDKDVVIDASDIPDLVPVVSVLASARPPGLKTYIVNAERLRYKESDRLAAVEAVINMLGGKAENTEDSLIVEGVGRLKGGTIDSYNDHRIAMMAAIAAACSDEPVVIERAEAVNKSYPNFFKDYVRLGGEIKKAEGNE